LPVTLAFVAACDGDQEEWRRRWLRTRGLGEEQAPAYATPRSQPEAPESVMPRPTELPLRPRGFAVRREILRQLATGPLAPPLVITGPFGVGKSDFALRHAHGVAGRMDGHLYADFASLGLGEDGARAALGGFLSRLGISAERSDGPLEQRAALYRSLLTERRLLVLLENVCDERQVRPLLAESRQSQTIIVSRAPLLGLRDVRRVRLDVLSRPESIEFIAATAPALAGAESYALDRLAEMCADRPLALDIAARRFATLPGVDPFDVINRLSEPGAWLEWLRVGDLSVREALEATYQRLSEPARMLLPLLISPRSTNWSHRHHSNELTEELIEAGFLRHRPGTGEMGVDALTFAFIMGRGIPGMPGVQPAGPAPYAAVPDGYRTSFPAA
jgi:hypothetical protein